MVFLLAGPSQVVIDHLSNDSRPVGKPGMFDFLPLGSEVFHQTLALCALAGAVKALEDDEVASLGATGGHVHGGACAYSVVRVESERVPGRGRSVFYPPK